MRNYHQQNPFHRIQRWNGSYYRSAELREVGTYLLVRHHIKEEICETLGRWCHILDSAELENDRLEQEELRRPINVPVPESPPDPGDCFDEDIVMDDDEILREIGDEAEDLADDEEPDEDEGDAEETYPGAYPGAGVDPAMASASIASLHRVVHTNGIHHIAMVACQCQGEDIFPLDLFAAHLLPASLKRIKTLFTAQVLDMYRLSNLELKSAAYQFYQLLRRLTKPMEPAEVLNVYREFRRMTRIWRWMKKLKWASYAGSSKKVKDVGAGELAIFCPACPQQGINIPDNWRDDHARQVTKLVIHNQLTNISLDGSINVY
jgi:hypothetical protein